MWEGEGKRGGGNPLAEICVFLESGDFGCETSRENDDPTTYEQEEKRHPTQCEVRSHGRPTCAILEPEADSEENMRQMRAAMGSTKGAAVDVRPSVFQQKLKSDYK